MNTLTHVETLHNPQEYHLHGSNHSHTYVGSHGESYVAQLFKQAGYIVRYCGNLAFSGDLCVTDTKTGEVLKIEVKTALECNHGRYGFCLRKAGKTDCGYSDYVALLCIDKHNQHYLYLIPASLLSSTYTKISSHPNRYAGKYAPFRVREQINISATSEIAELWSVKS